MHIPSSSTPRSSTQSPQAPISSPPLDTPTPTEPVQIIILRIRESATIEDAASPDGEIWERAIDILQRSEGFRRVYWGRYVENEDEEKGVGRVQIVIVRDSLSLHHTFLASQSYESFLDIFASLTPSNSPSKSSNPIPTSNQKITIYHAHLSHFTENPSTLCNAPITGTAIYLTTSRPGWSKAWNLWTTLVPYVPGCLGCTGGWIEESVDRHEAGFAYVVYVGWRSIEDHEEYHTTRDFARKRVVLGLWNAGWKGYGHVRFSGVRGEGVDGGDGESIGRGKREEKL